MRRSYLNEGSAAFAMALVCFFSGGNALNARDLGFVWASQGMTHSLVLSIPDRTYLHYKNKPRIRNYSRYTLEDPGFQTVGMVAHALEKKAKTLGFSDWQTVNFIISFVQYLDYKDEEGEYPRYPAETLVEGAGDCEDTSILLSALLRELGYDC
ncbi:MAG TPA: hypothetical protein ENJ82_13625, partial [Bacteroidetes bacterium]|nr:hypothetical protein [Bacteroidota bacterium]